MSHDVPALQQPATPDPLSRRNMLRGSAVLASGAAAATIPGIARAAGPSQPGKGAEASPSADEPGPAPSDSVVHTHHTPAGTEYYVLGTPLPGPQRVLLTFSNHDPAPTHDDLATPYYTQAAIYLRRLGYLVVGMDAPSHGSQIIDPVNDLGIPGWAWRLSNGMDFIAEHNQRMRDVVDDLVAQGITEPGMVATQGTSRGGFLAYHYAMHDDRVACALGFSPITVLEATNWFAPIADNPLVKKLTLSNPDRVAEIMGVPQFTVIGDRDTLVSNVAAEGWSQQVSDAARNAGVTREIAFNQLSEPRGHTVPPGGQLMGAAWILRVMQKMTPEQAAATAAINGMTW